MNIIEMLLSAKGDIRRLREDTDKLAADCSLALERINRTLARIEKDEAELDTVPWTRGGRGVAE